MDAVLEVERAFYWYAQDHLREAFPQLPDRSQFNRLQRTHRDAITVFALFLVQLLQAQNTAYEVLDSTAAVTRDAKRRGLGWLAGQADIGWSNRIGWYEGFHLLLCVTAQGVITGFGGWRARARTISTWLPPCLPLATPRRHACPAPVCLLRARMWPIKALRVSGPGGSSLGCIRSIW